ncbi:hypothetical protein L6452_27279 [Arctium lappa]|uniref:Uncharacterized protein n=1 Tax=Arctium lappa TaxID=4217 RepID=A0ACB8ZWC9_ARCLA|nr:hypothetical protein L6452_27279 [Arctium lappa]
MMDIISKPVVDAQSAVVPRIPAAQVVAASLAAAQHLAIETNLVPSEYGSITSSTKAQKELNPFVASPGNFHMEPEVAPKVIVVEDS